MASAYIGAFDFSGALSAQRGAERVSHRCW
jgi:hypothetical protein